jgi:glycine/D-amino acid oxidase-like deaminating enzyme
MSASTMSVDTAIVGTGIVGCWAAHASASLGGSLLLIDRGGLCAGTSRSSEGNLLVSDRTEEIELKLMVRSLELWRGLAGAVDGDFEFDSKGSLLIATVPSEVEPLKRHLAWLRSQGVRCELAADDAWKLEPNLSPEVAAVGWFPDDAQVQPMLVCYRIVQRLVRDGARLRLYDGVARLERQRSGVMLHMESGARIAAGRVVICAGVDTPGLLEPLGVTLPVVPRRGHIAVLEPGVEVRRKLVDFGYNATLSGHGGADPPVQVAAVVESTASGTILCGSSRQFAGFDRAVDLRTIGQVLRACTALVPALLGLRVIRTYVGLRPFSPDGLPMIGWIDAGRTIAVATGHEGSGHGLAAVTGELVRALLEDRVSPFHPHVDPLRFTGWRAA